MILLLVFRAVPFISTELPKATDFFVIYLLLGATCVLKAFIDRSNRLSFIKNLCYAAAYAAAGTVYLLTGGSVTGGVILMMTFLGIILVNRVFAAIFGSHWSYRLINILIALAVAVLIVASIMQEHENYGKFMTEHSILVACKTLANIIIISFSHMRLGILRKVIRKTYAAEIIFGLVLLMGSFAFVFQVIEPDIESYSDALWYCFAVVTTIGFGDFTVTNIFSRALSVILGVYGIIVVALTTSVIVNFYNEVKDKSDKELEDGAEAGEEEDAQA